MDEIERQFQEELTQRLARMFEDGERVKELRMGLATIQAAKKAQAKPAEPPQQ